MELGVLRKLEGQHRDLLRRRAAVEQALSELAGLGEKGEEAEDTLMRAMSLLTALRRELREHFALEEQADFLKAAAEAAPRLSRRAGRLGDEHVEMVRSLATILDDLITAQAAPGRWPELAESFSRFSEMFSAHERAENEIVRGAFMDDLGGGD